jgi:hypothetical protein
MSSHHRDEHRSLIRASELSATVPQSETFTSFCRFIGDEPFSPSDEFFSMMQELERDGVTWISTLEERKKKDSGPWPLDTVIPNTRCLTMGPLEGALEWDLSNRGAASVVAIEGKRENYRKCQVLKTIFPALPMRFVEGDVLDTDFPTDVDVVFCPGVLYHLSEPHRLLQKIYELKPKLAFIATQLAVDPAHPASAVRNLTDATELVFQGRTYRGRLFPEGRSRYLSGLDRDQPSIWLYAEDLMRLITDVGLHVEDHYVVDLKQEGLCGIYVTSASSAAAASEEIPFI